MGIENWIYRREMAIDIYMDNVIDIDMDMDMDTDTDTNTDMKFDARTISDDFSNVYLREIFVLVAMVSSEYTEFKFEIFHKIETFPDFEI
jgi:hypothetical protein